MTSAMRPGGKWIEFDQSDNRPGWRAKQADDADTHIEGGGAQHG